MICRCHIVITPVGRVPFCESSHDSVEAGFARLNEIGRQGYVIDRTCLNARTGEVTMQLYWPCQLSAQEVRVGEFWNEPEGSVLRC